MKDKKEEQKRLRRSETEKPDRKTNPFASLDPLQQERILTHMNTVGTREEIRRTEGSMRSGESGMMDTL